METISTVDEISVSYRPSIKNVERKKITCSQDSFREFKKFFDDDTIELNEQFMVMYLNRANKIIGVYKASVGGITSTVVDVRLILGVALKTVATGIILAHNHPSGNLTPSRSDQEITSRIKAAGQLMDISVLDHIILAQGDSYKSFADEGIL